MTDATRAITPVSTPLTLPARRALPSPDCDDGIVAHSPVATPPTAIATMMGPPAPAASTESGRISAALLNLPAAITGDRTVSHPPVIMPEDRVRISATDQATVSGDALTASRVAGNMAIERRGLSGGPVTGLDAKVGDGPRGDRLRPIGIDRAAPVVSAGSAPVVPAAPQSLPIGDTAIFSTVDKAVLIASSDRKAEIAGPETSILSVVPGGAPSVASTTDMGLTRPQTPLLAQHVAQQLSVALHRQSGGATDIAFDPVELGRVRMTVMAHDQTITMVVVADRPETADLMRRHIDVLQQEFRGLGYTSVNLTFERGQDRPTAQSQDGSAAKSPHTDTTTDDAPAPIAAMAGAALRAADGSLDLRL